MKANKCCEDTSPIKTMRKAKLRVYKVVLLDKWKMTPTRRIVVLRAHDFYVQENGAIIFVDWDAPVNRNVAAFPPGSWEEVK